jgi:secernin
MCDTVCVLRPERTLFGKNSDRPVGEPQVIESHAPRSGGGTLRTQYLEIPDTGAAAVLGSRPTWLWGFEHGVNEHRVAIGNEKVWTIDDPAQAPDALIGMDLVRLGLERSRTADAAIDVMTALLEEHGQGGVADQIDAEAYFSSFLVADPTGAWLLETSGRTWAAKPVAPGSGAAISNRISLEDDWARASSDVPAGTSFERWRDPEAWSAIADIRLACTVPAVTGSSPVEDPAGLAALLRHHGERPWGEPGGDPTDVDPLPDPRLGPEAEGVTVCMHVRDYQVTAASMIAELRADQAPLRAWVALGRPCVGVYLPVFPFDAVPVPIGSEHSWRRFDALRARAEGAPEGLAEIRAVLGPLEAELWEEADEIASADDPRGRSAFAGTAWDRVDGALAQLGV